VSAPSRTIRAALAAALLAAILPASGGCARRPHPQAPVGEFHGTPPHGGLAVPFGDGDYNLELVLDRDAGTLSAYVLDDDLEQFIRCGDHALKARLGAGGREFVLELGAVANPATGETVGDTACFRGASDALKGTGEVSGTIEAISVRGSDFSGLKFTIPGLKEVR
jgi:hypothetical protein